MNTHLRRGAASAAILLSLGLLSACGNASTHATPSASPVVTDPASGKTISPSAKPSVTVGKDLESIKVVGEPLKEPKVTVPAPWGIEKTQVKVLKEGTGPTVQSDGSVTVQYHGVNGRTGKVFDSSFVGGGQPVTFPLDGVIKGFKTGLEGQKVGSRVLIGVTGSDGYDSSGGQPSAGIEKGDTLLFVCDIVATSLTGPEGTPVAAIAGLPTVSTDATPKITVPSGYKAGATTQVQPIIQGAGQAIQAGDAITVNYTELSAETGKELYTTYGKKPETGALGQMIQGWRKGLVGQKLGSRVLLVVPKAEDLGKEDKIFVVDLLFTQKG